MTDTSVMENYTDAIDKLPPEAFLGALCWFSISAADVDLDGAHRDLTAAGLSTARLKKILRPVDAFKKASREVAHKFPPKDGIRSELMVRPVGEDGDMSYRYLMLERAVVQAGKKRRVFYEKVGELTFVRGTKKDGEYTGFSVESRRTTANLGSPLTDEEDAWLTARLDDFEQRFDHLLNYMDSHAVRTFVRDYIDDLSGTCVKESGGLYFVGQQHADEIAKLGQWVKSIGSEFHTLPLLNLADQRQMIAEAFETETLTELQRMGSEIAKILSDPNRAIEEKTFDAYGNRAAELAQRVKQYNDMLDVRSEQAAIELQMFATQVMSLSSRIRQPKKMTVA